MKRLLSLCLALIIALSVLPARIARADEVTLSVTGGWLRLRAAASFDAETISSYYTGTKVTVLGASGAWYYVRTPDGRVGYMYGRYLTASPSGGTAGNENITAYVTSANGKGVRMRTGPGTAYGVVKLLSVGTRVTILSSGTYWHYITVDGLKGYMMAKYLSAEQVTPPADPDSTTSYTAYITSPNGKGVNLRKGPSTGYASYGLYAVGTQVTVKAHTGNWSYVTIGNRDGYMMTKYLTTTKPAVPGDTSYTAYVTSSNGKGVNLRKGPSTGYASYGTVAVGTRVTVLSTSGQWSYVDTGVRKGYMMSKYLTTQAPSGSGTAAGYTAYVTSSNGKGVYLRSGPGIGYSSLGLYSVGTQVTVLQHNATWDFIRIGTREGYMMNKYLTTTKPGSGSYTITGVTLSNLYPVSGETLWANVMPSGANVTYEWLTDNGLLLSTSASYKLTDSDVGRLIRVRVTGVNGYTGSAVSGFAVVGAAGSGSNQSNTLKMATIDNANPVVGDTLTAGVLPAGATASYSWIRSDGTQVGSAKAYTVQKSDVGYSLYVRVTGTGSYTGTVTSSQTAVVRDNTPAPIPLSGKVEIASAIMCGVTLEPKLSLNTTNVNYQWYVGGVMVSTSRSLTITNDMAGKEIKLVVTSADSSYTGRVESNVCTVLGGVATRTDL